MAKSFRVLYVASEIKPFLNETYVSDIVRKLPQEMQEKGVEIRILIQFGTGSQVFLILPVCSVNNDILLIIHVAFIILQMSDFLRLALDVYVFTRYGHNTGKIQT